MIQRHTKVSICQVKHKLDTYNFKFYWISDFKRLEVTTGL